MTTTTDRFKSRARRGFTLAEVLISVTISGIVLAASTGSLLFLSKSTASMGNYQEMNMTSRFALDRFASDARMTKEVDSCGSTSVSLQIYNSSGALDTVVYSFDSGAGTFSRTVNGTADTILEDVESVSLTYYTLRRDPTTTPLEVKEIQLQAVMRRNVLSIGNTNEIISARFMMRNRAVSI